MKYNTNTNRMMKNDITYEYRVFTNRLVDVETMEVGICTSKVIKELNPKSKVDGRFFHTSDTDEWYFCWKGELQKLNLKGNSDVTAALAEVEKLIANANAAVSDAKATAKEAKAAADAASDAVKSIEDKADKADVEALDSAIKTKADATIVDSLSTTVAGKADASAVDVLVAKVDSKADKSELDSKATIESVNSLTELVAGKADSTAVKDLSDKVAAIKLDDYALKSDMEGFATETFVGEEIAKIDIPTVPTNISYFENDKGYLTADDADLKYAPIGGEGVDLSDYAKKDFVTDEIAKSVPTKVSELTNDAGYLTAHQDISGKQDVIADLDAIRANAALAKTALQEVPAEYVTEEELVAKGYLTSVNMDGKQDVIEDLADIRANAALAKTALQEVPAEYVTEEELAAKGYLTEHQSLDNYYTKSDIDNMIGVAIEKTNTILNA